MLTTLYAPRETTSPENVQDQQWLQFLWVSSGDPILYEVSPCNALVLCLDEQTQIHALDRTPPRLPLSEGETGGPTIGDRRNGAAVSCSVVDALTGVVIGRDDKWSRSKEFLAFLKQGKHKHRKTSSRILYWIISALTKPGRSGGGSRAIENPLTTVQFDPRVVAERLRRQVFST